MNAKKAYNLRPKARLDLQDIYSWGREQFGERQAEFYLFEIFDHLDLIKDKPGLFPQVNNYHAGLRRCPIGAHSIYYIIEEDEISVVRIIGRQDPIKSFAGQFE